MTNPAWARRRTAARKYQPTRTRLLLVAGSPPDDEQRYFYFEDADSNEPLFDEVCAVLFEGEPSGDKVRHLKELRRRGVFVTELKPDAPRTNEKLAPYVMPFLLNIEPLAPEQIVLIGAEEYDVLHPALEKAGLPVIDVRVPPPSSEVEFRQKLRLALVRADLERLIQPLPVGKAKKGGDES
jgi:hypothetical protein